MHFTEGDFKKLLVDLGLRPIDVARAIGKAPNTVTYYFRGRLKNSGTRLAIKRVLRDRARIVGVALPEFWKDTSARSR
jgi:hypothetical protein